MPFIIALTQQRYKITKKADIKNGRRYGAVTGLITAQIIMRCVISKSDVL